MNFKKIVATAAVGITCFTFGACMSTEAKAEQTYHLKIWRQNDNGTMTTFVVVDEETDVNYIVVRGLTRGNGDISVAITPRLNADGTLYTSK